MQFKRHSYPVYQLDAGGRHATPRGVAGNVVKGAGSIRDDKDFVPGLNGKKGRKGDTDLGRNAGDDQLLTTGGSCRCDKILVIPSVDLPYIIEKTSGGISWTGVKNPL